MHSLRETAGTSLREREPFICVPKNEDRLALLLVVPIVPILSCRTPQAKRVPETVAIDRFALHLRAFSIARREASLFKGFLKQQCDKIPISRPVSRFIEKRTSGGRASEKHSRLLQRGATTNGQSSRVDKLSSMLLALAKECCDNNNNTRRATTREYRRNTRAEVRIMDFLLRAAPKGHPKEESGSNN